MSSSAISFDSNGFSLHDMEKALAASLAVTESSKPVERDEGLEHKSNGSDVKPEDAREKATAESALTKAQAESMRASAKPKEDADSVALYELLMKDSALLAATYEGLWKGPRDEKSASYNERYKTALLKSNEPLNRYSNVPGCDETLFGKDIANFYINGNLITAKSGAKYLMTQGPLAKTEKHFLQAICHLRSSVVVCTVMQYDGTGRNRKEKCSPYWTRDKIVTDDGWTAMPAEKEPKTIHKKADQMCTSQKWQALHKDGKQTHEFHLIRYYNWPDQGAADIEVFSSMQEEIAQKRGASPVTAHCSAGLGRAAVTIAGCEVRLDQNCNVFDTVNCIRQQRNCYSVQNADQLKLIIAFKLQAMKANPWAATSSSSSSSSSSSAGDKKEEEKAQS